MNRLPPEVYRRRRIVVFGGLALVIVLIVIGVWAMIAQVGKIPNPGDTGTPGSTDEPVETAEPCVASNIVVEPVTDATVYAAGVMPQLSIQLTNTGAVGCTINVGTSTQVFTVTSGEDLWWRSTDCQIESSDMFVTLEAGQTRLSTDPVQWNRERSSPSTCDSASRPAAPGGGASYHVSVEIGGFTSAATKQILLN